MSAIANGPVQKAVPGRDDERPLSTGKSAWPTVESRLVSVHRSFVEDLAWGSRPYLPDW